MYKPPTLYLQLEIYSLSRFLQLATKSNKHFNHEIISSKKDLIDLCPSHNFLYNKSYNKMFLKEIKEKKF